MSFVVETSIQIGGEIVRTRLEMHDRNTARELAWWMLLQGYTIGYYLSDGRIERQPGEAERAYQIIERFRGRNL